MAGLAAFVMLDLDDLLAVAEWAKSSPSTAWPPFIIVFALAVVVMVPGWLFMVAGGYLFGLAGGLVVSVVANLLGSIAAFVLAKRYVRDWVRARLGGTKKFSDFDAAAEKNGLYAVMIARLALLPNNFINYASGITAMGLRDFAIGTAVGGTPILVVNVLVGASAVDLMAALDSAESDGQTKLVLMLGGAVIVLVGIVWLARRYSSRLLSRSATKAESEPADY